MTLIITTSMFIAGLVCAVRSFIMGKKHNNVDYAMCGVTILFATAVIILGIVLLTNPDVINTEVASDESLQNWYWFSLPFIFN